MDVLELFAGSRSVGKVAESMGHRVFSVDWKPFQDINLVIDIRQMTAADVPFTPDIVWASFDCTTYTIAAISTHRDGVKPKTHYARQCDEVNQYVISLVQEWLRKKPGMKFYFENPRGMLRKMPFMQNFIRHTVWYCQYGDTRAKPTDIWTNDINWKPRPICHNGNPNCHHEPAPRGSKTGTQGIKGSYDRSRIPTELVKEILMSRQAQETYDPTTSDCCGANRDADHGICLECKEHCDGVTFEDADGLPVTQYVDANGYLQDEPTADCNADPIANAVGKVMAATALLCLIAFYVGVATGGGQ